MEVTASEPARVESAAQGSCDAEDTDEEDPVVQECDVYLNGMYDPPDFVGDMYVLQYPLRPTYRPYGDQGYLERVDLKHKSRRLRFVYKLQKNANYDDDSEDRLQRHVLNSVVVANPACSYAVGVVHQGKMTITPLRAVNQLRPDFAHIDQQKQKKQAQAAAVASGKEPSNLATDDPGSGGERVDKDDIDLSMTAQAVEVQFGTQPGGPASGEIEADEPWTQLDSYTRSSAEARDIYEKHLIWPAAAAAEAEAEGCDVTHPSLQQIHLDGDREAFLGTMCGQRPPREHAPKTVQRDGLSAFVLSRMPVERQVEAVVRHFGVLSTKQLRKRLPPHTLRRYATDESLHTVLRQCAVLVAGNWILKSELAGFTEGEACARDMLLCLFNKKDGVLHHKEFEKWHSVFASSTQRASRDEMVRGFAEPGDRGETLRLRAPPDLDLIQRYPEDVKANHRWWDEHRTSIVQRMTVVRAERGASSSASFAASVAKRHSMRLMEDVREALAMSAMTIQDLRRHIQKKHPTVAIRENDLHSALQESEESGSSGVVHVRDMLMLDLTGNEANDKYRKMLVQIFSCRDTLLKSDIHDEYERVYGEKCPLSEYVQRGLLREIAERADDSYVLKSSFQGF